MVYLIEFDSTQHTLAPRNGEERFLSLDGGEK